jgi:hypothetical protein
VGVGGGGGGEGGGGGVREGEGAVGLTPNAELYAADCGYFELFTPKVGWVGGWVEGQSRR